MSGAFSTIPEFPDFTEIKLEQKPYFDALFRNIQPEISDFSFTDLFAWRVVFSTKAARYKKNALVLMKSPKKEKYFFVCPMGADDLPESVDLCVSYLREKYGRASIYAVPQNVYEQVKGRYPDGVFRQDRDYFDYVYKVKDLITLDGPKFAGKRNFVKRFKNNYKYGFEEIGHDNIEECRVFLEKWRRLKSCRDVFMMHGEISAVKEMLDNFGELGLTGGLLRVNGAVEAFAAASGLNKNTVQIHAEKANPEFKGIYQAINQMFLENVCSGYKFVNREQDMGEEGLRKAKLSYHPYKMVEKYKVSLVELS